MLSLLEFRKVFSEEISFEKGFKRCLGFCKPEARSYRAEGGLIRKTRSPLVM